MPPAVQPQPQVILPDIRFRAGHDDITHRQSFQGEPEGPMNVTSTSWIAQQLAPLLLLPLNQGTVVISMRLLEYLTLDAFTLAEDISLHSLAWFIRPNRIVDLITALIAAGLSWEPVKSTAEARERIGVIAHTLPDGLRKLELADVIHYAQPESGSWWDFLTPRRIITKCAGDTSSLTEFRLLVCGCYLKTDYATEPFSSVLTTLGVPRIQNMSHAAIAGGVLSFFADTRPQCAALVGFYSTDAVHDEIARRNNKTPSERFVPLCREHWAEAFPNLKKAFPHRFDGY